MKYKCTKPVIVFNERNKYSRRRYFFVSNNVNLHGHPQSNYNKQNYEKNGIKKRKTLRLARRIYLIMKMLGVAR